MAALRDPETGCAWDLKQDFRSIAPYTIEEAYEVADAAERGDMPHLCEELGDLLLQVVFFAQMASEQNLFHFEDVVHAITSKLVRRHPHIFSDRKADTPEQVKAIWDEIKASERSAPKTLLGDVAHNAPGLERAVKLQQQASTVGFDWNDPHAVIKKLREELDEYEVELKNNHKQREQDELGDILFALANLARHRKIDPEQAIRDANTKFTRRFSLIEKQAKDADRTLDALSLDEMQAMWDAIKAEEAAANLKS